MIVKPYALCDYREKLKLKKIKIKRARIEIYQRGSSPLEKDDDKTFKSWYAEGF